MFCKKGVLRNLTKFTRKHLCQSLFFDKVAGLRRLNAAILCILPFIVLMFLTYQASEFNNWEKWEILLCFHHTQREVFFQIKFHPEMIFYLFHPGMKLTCKHKFFHPWMSFIPGWDFTSVTCKRTLTCFTTRLYVYIRNSNRSNAIMYGLWRTLRLEKKWKLKEVSGFTVKLQVFVFLVQAFQEITQKLFKICLTPWKNN